MLVFKLLNGHLEITHNKRMQPNQIASLMPSDMSKSLLVYSIATWFVLWTAFFLQMERESSPLYDAGIIRGVAGLIFLILVYIIVIAVLCTAQFIWFKINVKRNNT